MTTVGQDYFAQLMTVMAVLPLPIVMLLCIAIAAGAAMDRTGR